MINVLVADDQELVRSGFALMLEVEADIAVIAQAVDGLDAVDQARSHRPDVILMDIRMPRMDGVEATRQLVRAGSPTRVLVLTTFVLDEYVYDAMRAGASGFLLKDVPREQLVFAVRMVARGDAVVAPKVTRRLVEHYVGSPPPTTGVPEVLTDLSERELEVFGLLASGRSNAEIADALVLGEATVKTHVGSILSKLDLRDRIQAVVLAYESGFLQRGG